MRRVQAVFVIAAAAAALAGCSSAASSSSSTPGGGSSASPAPMASTSSAMSMPASAAAVAPGSVHVLAPATMTASLPVLDKQFTAANPGVTVGPDIGHTPQQVTALHSGETADVLISAGAADMAQAQQYGLLAGGPAVFASDEEEIVVAQGNPKHITTLADLAKPGVTVVLSSPMMPIGGFSSQVLAKAHVTVKPASMEMGGPDIVNKVALGDADAGIVFVTDVASGGAKVEGVPIPAADQVIAPFEVAVLKSAPHPAQARAFAAFLTTAPAQAALKAGQFLPPSMAATSPAPSAPMTGSMMSSAGSM